MYLCGIIKRFLNEYLKNKSKNIMNKKLFKFILKEVSNISLKQKKYEELKDDLIAYEKASTDSEKLQYKSSINNLLYTYFLQQEIDSELYNSYFEHDDISKRYNIVSQIKKLDDNSNNKLYNLINNFSNDIKNSIQHRDIQSHDKEWFQIDLNNKNDVLSKTIQKKDSDTVFRRHNLYATIKSDQINFSTKKVSYSALCEYINNFKNLVIDAIEEFYSLNEIPGSKYHITKFKVLNINNFLSDKYVIKSDYYLFNLISFSDNFKIYFSNISLQNSPENQKEYEEFVNDIKEILNKLIIKHNLVNVKRSRSEVGIDFQKDSIDPTTSKKTEHKFSYGQAVGLILTNTLLNNSNVLKSIINYIEQNKNKEIRDYINTLTNKVEKYVLDHNNLDKIIDSLTKAKQEGILK